MFGQVTWEDQFDSGLDIVRAQSAFSVISGQFGGFEGQSFEKISHEGVHDVHCLLGHSDFWVDVLKHFIDVDGV